MCLYKESYFKELAAIVQTGVSKICSVGWQAGDPGEPLVSMKSKCRLLEISLSLGGQPLTDWTRPAHVMDGHLFYPTLI